MGVTSVSTVDVDRLYATAEMHCWTVFKIQEAMGQDWKMVYMIHGIYKYVDVVIQVRLCRLYKKIQR